MLAVARSQHWEAAQGDGLAYACARSHGAPLLHKGEDSTLADFEWRPDPSALASPA